MRAFIKKVSTIAQIDWLIAGWLVLIILITSLPFFSPTLFRVHDYVHGARIAELSRAAQAGHLPVRWTANFGFGYGMPLFEFYAPLPYYIGSFIYWLSSDLILASKALFVIPNIATVIGAYLLGKELYGRKGGIIVATAYALAPYRAVNLFVRGAISESWGVMVLPFILWTGIKLLRALKAKKFGEVVSGEWLSLVLSLAVLFLSHNLTTLMFVPVSFIFLAVIAWQESIVTGFKKLSFNLLSLGSAYAAAIGLTAFYLFPALLEKDFTIISSILSGYFFYSHHFLYIRQFFTPSWGYGGSAWGPDDGFSFFLGYGQLLAVGISVLAIGWHLGQHFIKHSSWSLGKQLVWLTQKSMRTSHLQLFVVSGLIVTGSLYLTLLKSEWWWQTLPLISYIQFPWRWLTIATLFLSIMAGYGATLITRKPLLQITVVGVLALISLNALYFKPESYLSSKTDFYYSDAELIRKEMSGVLPDYIPVGLKLKSLAKPEEATQSGLLEPNTNGNVLTPTTETRVGKYSVAVNHPHQKLIDLELASEQPVEFAVAAYPGWTAELDGQPTPIDPTPQGLLGVTVPAGRHSVGVQFGSTPVRQLSDLVSGITAVVLLIVVTPTISSTLKKTAKKK